MEDNYHKKDIYGFVLMNLSGLFVTFLRTGENIWKHWTRLFCCVGNFYTYSETNWVSSDWRGAGLGFNSFQTSVPFHRETSHLICHANEIIALHMKCNAGVNKLTMNLYHVTYAFRVNLHSVITWSSRNCLLKTGAISQI